MRIETETHRDGAETTDDQHMFFSASCTTSVALTLDSHGVIDIGGQQTA